MADIARMADDMVTATKGKDTSMIGAAFDGLISMPVTMGYLAYDFLDTDTRYERDTDKIRLMFLIKNGYANKETLYKILTIIISYYLSQLSEEQREQVYINALVKEGGKIASNTIVLGQMNAALVSGLVRRILFGVTFSTILTLGADQARAVYTSRRLMASNPTLYWKLRTAGDLDLLYFLVKDFSKPFEDAILLKGQDEDAFNRLIDIYLKKLAE
ncbi:hypothetical protein FHU10_3762 [Serratia fonticola]|uniref:Uncharacterized protein n=1 Tax=Serratia fonticola TaxID=47917 RepID=A0A559T948_SERFO|nr:hypothetical protein [Serratia fonticola]TQI81328.1 hypothetical protein FHU09_3945 [Serratia fonticola]TQI96648.1 hypothetical protein FHU11_2101 [Serratia fonticola]TVZ71145.1 hypothetical protein FHU10_3762 [Serratia fonticola]